jgi:hypothetical protein
MFDMKTSIHMVRFILHWDWDEDPGLRIHYDILFSRLPRKLFEHDNTYAIT